MNSTSNAGFGPVLAVRSLLSDLTVPYWIAGGWAIDLAVGRVTRDHADVDIMLLERDEHALRTDLTEVDVQLIGHDGQPGPWPAGTEPGPRRPITAPGRLVLHNKNLPLPTEVLLASTTMNCAIDNDSSNADPARGPPAVAWAGRSPGRPPSGLVPASPPPAGTGLPGPGPGTDMAGPFITGEANPPRRPARAPVPAAAPAGRGRPPHTQVSTISSSHSHTGPPVPLSGARLVSPASGGRSRADGTCAICWRG
jgi:hypothetical protein